MSNILSNGLQWLQTQLETHASLAVEYRRVNTEDWIEIPAAVIGRSQNQVETNTGLMVNSNFRDFIVRPSFFKQFDPPCPLRNDSVRYEIDGVEMLFRVNSDGVASHYEEIDGFGVAIRIHTVRDLINATNR